MKKFLLLALTIFAFPSVKAQDLVVLKNADEIQVKVISITPDSVTYKKWSNLEGPTYTIPRSNVFYIKYQNGEKEVIQNLTPNSSSLSDNSKIKLQGHATLGCIFNEAGGGPTLDVSVGAKIYEHFYIGAETGFHSLLTHVDYEYVDPDGNLRHVEGTLFEGYIPLGVNMKGYITKNKVVNPYINCSLGGFFGIGDTMNGWNGFYCQVGAGFNIKHFTFGIGYSGLVKYDTASCGYIKLGVRFGK